MVIAACEKTAIEILSGIAKEEEGDTIYAVDKVSEELLIEFFEREIATQTSVVLIAEGLDDGKIILPRGKTEEECDWRIIVDPIGICCHPYDLCTELIARESGVIITDERGENLSVKLSVEPDVAWLGYANKQIQNQIEPLLRSALENRNLI